MYEPEQKKYNKKMLKDYFVKKKMEKEHSTSDEWNGFVVLWKCSTHEEIWEQKNKLYTVIHITAKKYCEKLALLFSIDWQVVEFEQRKLTALKTI